MSIVVAEGLASSHPRVMAAAESGWESAVMARQYQLPKVTEITSGTKPGR